MNYMRIDSKINLFYKKLNEKDSKNDILYYQIFFNLLIRFMRRFYLISINYQYLKQLNFYLYIQTDIYHAWDIHYIIKTIEYSNYSVKNR